MTGSKLLVSKNVSQFELGFHRLQGKLGVGCGNAISGCADCLTNMLEKSIALRPSIEPLVSESVGLYLTVGLSRGVILPTDPLNVYIDNARKVLPEIVAS